MTKADAGLSSTRNDVGQNNSRRGPLDRRSYRKAIQGIGVHMSCKDVQLPCNSVLFVNYSSGRRIQEKPPSMIVMVFVEVEHIVQSASDGVG
jgi:hypothetical protein